MIYMFISNYIRLQKNIKKMNYYFDTKHIFGCRLATTRQENLTKEG